MQRLQLLCVLIVLSVCGSYSLPQKTRSPPVFDTNYSIKGVLLLPYAEIREPFAAFYDQQNKRSRIDYYGNTVQTYQRADMGDFGVSYKIAYMPDESGTPVRTCFQVNGSNENPVGIQSIIPDLSVFGYVKDADCYEQNSLYPYKPNDDLCELWQAVNSVGDKENKYSMYISKTTGAPVHYVMRGYNNLLGSHYDKYELYYSSYEPGSVTDDDFEIDTSIECGNFPGPGVERMVFNNPMIEFINNEDTHVHESFEDFKEKHGKSYSDPTEHESRKNIYRQNYRYVQSMNRAGLTYALKLNHMADFNDAEFRTIRGRLPSSGYNGGKPFPKEEFSEAVPDSLDWRLYGAVTPVKDQAVCGSCWSFGTTGTIEGAYFLKNNKLVRLSQQQLIDCSWKFENNGCDGGEDFRAYKYIMEAGGLASEEDYGHYLGQDGICHDKSVFKTAQLKGFVNVTSGDLNALKQAIAKKGPISVSIDASHKSFSFYSHGVYYDSDCKSGSDQLDHSVLAVGYGVMNGQPYWIVKNSWSTYWGNDGYVLMSQKDNNCGVATSPTYVEM
ncbi:digestive cysteine proteinase 1-like [Argiope bruennichi]|uniref:Counting factor associated protein D like protein n=1 Tax=Argiope bruennichi TaxID=94029 RepID=A0A8T0FDH8_ARGBR|nr:digestive cysteine proteinase 1-like [Argiope bruennichi]KAF8787469.1 Counting factor associated protein D like protein [Argiope bruennichi]